MCPSRQVLAWVICQKLANRRKRAFFRQCFFDSLNFLQLHRYAEYVRRMRASSVSYVLLLWCDDLLRSCSKNFSLSHTVTNVKSTMFSPEMW